MYVFFKMKAFASILIIVVISTAINSKKFNENDKPEWAKKDIRDYTDADMERLLDQWEVKRQRQKNTTLMLHFRRTKNH